jgi:MFS transporter, OFA family, oxalate/formate antiporter
MQQESSSPSIERRGWTVTLAATGIGLAMGNLYAWSVIKGSIPDAWGWTNADKALPYSVACLVFSLTMVPAGRLQDHVGPRWVSTIGGALAGVGCIVAGLGGSSIVAFVIGFGVLTGIGIGFGYSAMTPAAIKWFPSRRTGLITGIVVAGFGVASVYIAPLATWLLATFQRTNASGVVEKGVSSTMISLGAGMLVVVSLLSQLVRNPPESVTALMRQAVKAEPAIVEVPWAEMLKTGRFWLLWVMYFFGAAAGLMFISVAQDLGKRSLGEWAFVVVVVLAVGNAGGRILAGMVSDRIGRPWTMFAEFVCQGAVVAVLYLVTAGEDPGWPVILASVLLLGMNYGSNLSLFPAASKDFFGLKSFGMNYGLLFTAWGTAGLVMPWMNGLIRDTTGKSDLSFFIVIAMMLVAAGTAVFSRQFGRSTSESERPALLVRGAPVDVGFEN